jgi:hypothetical protein
MKKINKSKLSITPETIRHLSSSALGRVAGGVGMSFADSNCVSCEDCGPSRDPVCTQFPCITGIGATCYPVCPG